MNLSYRGIAYDSASPEIEMAETPHVGLFLGKSFKIKTAHVPCRQPEASRLRYRGVDYIH